MTTCCSADNPLSQLQFSKFELSVGSMIQICTLNENQVTANWTKNATIYVNAAQQRIFVLRIEKLQTQPVRAVSGRLWSWVVLLLPSHVTVLRHTPPLPSKAGITVPAYCYTRTSGHSWTWGLYCISQQTQPSHSSLKELNVARVTSLSLSPLIVLTQQFSGLDRPVDIRVSHSVFVKCCIIPVRFRHPQHYHSR